LLLRTEQHLTLAAAHRIADAARSDPLLMLQDLILRAKLCGTGFITQRD